MSSGLVLRVTLERMRFGQFLGVSDEDFVGEKEKPAAL